MICDWRVGVGDCDLWLVFGDRWLVVGDLWSVNCECDWWFVILSCECGWRLGFVMFNVEFIPIRYQQWHEPNTKHQSAIINHKSHTTITQHQSPINICQPPTTNNHHQYHWPITTRHSQSPILLTITNHLPHSAITHHKSHSSHTNHQPPLTNRQSPITLSAIKHQYQIPKCTHHIQSLTVTTNCHTPVPTHPVPTSNHQSYITDHQPPFIFAKYQITNHQSLFTIANRNHQSQY